MAGMSPEGEMGAGRLKACGTGSGDAQTGMSLVFSFFVVIGMPFFIGYLLLAERMKCGAPGTARPTFPLRDR